MLNFTAYDRLIIARYCAPALETHLRQPTGNLDYDNEVSEFLRHNCSENVHGLHAGLPRGSPWIVNDVLVPANIYGSMAQIAGRIIIASNFNVSHEVVSAR